MLRCYNAAALKHACPNRERFAPLVELCTVFLGLSLLTFAACNAHTPLVNAVARDQALAARGALETLANNTNPPGGIQLREVQQPPPEVPKPPYVPGQEPPPTRQNNFVHETPHGVRSLNATTLPTYPYFERDDQKLPIVFTRHENGAAYLTRLSGKYGIVSGPNVSEPPHGLEAFDIGKKTDPKKGYPYYEFPGSGTPSSSSLAMAQQGAIRGAYVLGYCTADKCTKERYYLLTYDNKMEKRLKDLKESERPSWTEYAKKGEFRAYFLKPGFTEFESGKAVSLKVERSELKLKTPDSNDEISVGLNANADGSQPLTKDENGRTIEFYRVADESNPLLVGKIKESSTGNDLTWFFAVPAPSSQPSGK